MQNCEKIKGEYLKKTDELKHGDSCSDKFQCKTVDYIILGNDYKMTKLSLPELKAKVIIVEEL